MRILLDTNILTRSAQPSHPQHGAATTSVSFLRTRGDSLFLAPQNLYEFWAVATRPVAENGLGMTVEATAERLKELKRSFILLQDTPSLFTTWESLVVQSAAKGKAAHDTRLVGAMRVNDLEVLENSDGHELDVGTSGIDEDFEVLARAVGKVLDQVVRHGFLSKGTARFVTKLLDIGPEIRGASVR